jgi:hypothetical protein
MPLYDTQCSTCQKQEIRKLSFEQYEGVSSGTVVLACACGGKPDLVFEPSAVSFVLKDGEAGGWISKATKENKYRAARRQIMGRRERDHVTPKRLVPNHNGQVTGSWSEAKDAAYQSTYARVNREHGARDAARAAAASAKTFDPHIKREAAS